LRPRHPRSPPGSNAPAAVSARSIVARLEVRGVFATVDVDSTRAEIEELAGSLAALQTLQTWVERELFAAREEGFAMSE
jgi:hypothetical protein